jgi:hypothetical protein
VDAVTFVVCIKVNRVGTTEAPVVSGGANTQDVAEEVGHEASLDANVWRFVLEPSIGTYLWVSESEYRKGFECIYHEFPLLIHNLS